MCLLLTKEAENLFMEKGNTMALALKEIKPSLCGKI
uniref:Uncharacterized protein n=1 Tax=Rhizophora mucronata TaxID=61149 RepID=A0A2P2J3W5_RHIMU